MKERKEETVCNDIIIGVHLQRVISRSGISPLARGGQLVVGLTFLLSLASAGSRATPNGSRAVLRGPVTKASNEAGFLFSFFTRNWRRYASVTLRDQTELVTGGGELTI